MGPHAAPAAAAATVATAAAAAAASRLWPAAAALLLALAGLGGHPAYAAALPAPAASTALVAPAAAAAAAAPAGGAPLDIDKRSVSAATADFGASDYPDYQRFDEYPVVVPKRTAMLLDRIMTELQHAMGEGGSAAGGGSAGPSSSKAPVVDLPDTMDLQRRGQQKGSRVYWRCYFNAVTCFRRK